MLSFFLSVILSLSFTPLIIAEATCASSIPTWPTPEILTLTFTQGYSYTAQVPSTCTQVGVKGPIGVASNDGSQFSVSVRDRISDTLQYSVLSTPADKVATCLYYGTDFPLSGATAVFVITCHTPSGCSIKKNINFYCAKGATSAAGGTTMTTTAPPAQPANPNPSTPTTSTGSSTTSGSGSNPEYRCISPDGTISSPFTPTESFTTYSFTFWKEFVCANHLVLDEFALVSDNPVTVTIDDSTTPAATCMRIHGMKSKEMIKVECVPPANNPRTIISSTCNVKYLRHCTFSYWDVLPRPWMLVLTIVISVSIVSSILSGLYYCRWRARRKAAAATIVLSTAAATGLGVNIQQQQQQIVYQHTNINNSTNINHVNSHNQTGAPMMTSGLTLTGAAGYGAAVPQQNIHFSPTINVTGTSSSPPASASAVDVFIPSPVASDVSTPPPYTGASAISVDPESDVTMRTEEFPPLTVHMEARRQSSEQDKPMFI